jgi:hypothetical protein
MLPFYNTKTILAIYNELSSKVSLPDGLLLDSTINSKYDLFKDLTPEVFPPKIKYFGIGIRGFRAFNDQNSTIPYKPDPSNMDLYYPIPFRCVPISNDLEEIERKKYRIRVMKSFNGINYWCYYLKELKYISSNIELVETNLETGDENQVLLNYNNLNPTPVDIVVPGFVDNTLEYNAYVNTIVEVTGDEVIESINILYDGDLTKCNISEIGLYSGEDRIVTDSIGNEYTESIYTQLMTHHCFNGTDLSNPSSSLIRNVRIVESTGFVL